MRHSKKKVFLFLFALVWCTLVAVNSYAADEFVIEGEISFGMDIERIQEIAKERGFGSSDYLSAWSREFRSLDYDNDVSYGGVEFDYKRFFYDIEKHELYQVAYLSNSIGGIIIYESMKDFLIQNYGSPLIETIGPSRANDDRWSKYFDSFTGSDMIRDAHWRCQVGITDLGIDLFFISPSWVIVTFYDASNPVSCGKSEKSSLSNETAESGSKTEENETAIFEYTVLDDGTAEITKYNGFESTLVIPDEIDGYFVTSIGDSAFSMHNTIMNVTLPANLLKIGGRAFYATYIKSLVIPESVVTVGDFAFSACDELESVCLPNSLSEISSGLFASCSKLSHVDIPETVIKIGESAFESCTSLKEITIPVSVVAIGENAFSGCTELRNVKLPERLTTLPGGLFQQCLSLEEIDLPIRLESVGNSVFSGCKALTNITLSDSVSSVGKSAFQFCDNLVEITLPESVESIGEKAFANCKKLASVSLPDGLKSISSSLFYHCESLSTIEVPENVETIGKMAFSHCDSLTSVTIPASVVEIGMLVFRDCKNLKDVRVVPGSYAEQYCIENKIPYSFVND